MIIGSLPPAVMTMVYVTTPDYMKPLFTTEIGNAKLGMIVADTLRRNKKITATTSTSVSNSVILTSRTDSSMGMVRSMSVVSCTLPGICVCIF